MAKAIPVPPADYLNSMLAYDPATGSLTWKVDGFGRKAGREAGCKKWSSRRRRHGGIYVTVNRKQYWAHRLIWAMVKGSIAEDIEIDHKDQDSWNNKWENLRLATRQQNAFNMRYVTTKPGSRGIFETEDGYFRVQLGGRKKHYVGTFVLREDAQEAYRKAVAERRGEFACSE